MPQTSGVVDWWFRDRSTGEIVIGQFPNPPLFVALGAWLARLVAPAGRVDDGLGWLVTGALVWWSVDEITRGVNPWRRLLGTVVLAGVVVGRLA